MNLGLTHDMKSYLLKVYQISIMEWGDRRPGKDAPQTPLDETSHPTLNILDMLYS